MEYITVLGNINAAHEYEVEVRTPSGRGHILVNAYNRAIAARLVEKAGYEVCSVNMTA